MNGKPAPTAAIVGAGLMGYWHATTLRRLGIRVTAVADRDRDRAVRLARQCGAPAFEEIGDLLRRADAAVVHLCTPREAHVQQVGAALDAGKHVLVEKPLAATGTETGALVERARRAGVVMCPVHQFPFQTACLRLLGDIQKLGRLQHIDYWTCSAGAHRGSDAAKDEIAADILPHPLSLLARFANADLSSFGWAAARPLPGELRALGNAGDVALGIMISMHGRPTVNALRIIGDKGTAHIDLFHDLLVLEAGRSSRGYKIVRPVLLAARTFGAASSNLASRFVRREPAYPGLRELIRRFYGTIAGSGAAPISPEEIVHIANARDRILAKAGA